MKVNSVTLDNIRSYDFERVEFEPGSNLIHGKNGAGKSSILQAIFGGLFQTSMTEQLGTDFTLDNIVNNESDEGHISLEFEITDTTYTVEWAITVSEDEDGERSAKTKYGYPKLSSDALPETIDGVRAVGSHIESLVGMDAESFVNSVYVQQGDITRLIHADSETRRQIIDGLLGLNRLDELIERMDKARLEFYKAKTDAKTLRQDSSNRLEELPELDEVQGTIQSKQNELGTINSDLAELRETLDGLKESKRTREQKLEDVQDVESDIEDVENKIDQVKDEYEAKVSKIKELRQQVSETESQKTTLQKECSEEVNALNGEVLDELGVEQSIDSKSTAKEIHKTAQRAVEKARTELQTLKRGELKNHESAVETAKSQLEEATQRVNELSDNISTLEERLSTKKDDLEAKKEAVSELEDDLQTKISRAQDIAERLGLSSDSTLDTYADDTIPEKHSQINTEREAVKEEIGRLETLLEQVDKLTNERECPLCGADEETHTHDFDDRETTLNEEKEANEKRLEELREENEKLLKLSEVVSEARSLRDSTLVSARRDVDDVETTIDDLTTTLSDTRDTLQQADEKRTDAKTSVKEAQKNVKKTNTRIESLSEERQQKEEVASRLERIVSLYDEIDEQQRTIESAKSEISHAQELRAEKKSQLSTLEDRKRSLEEKLEDIDVEELRSEISEITDTLIPEYEEKYSARDADKERVVERLAALKQQSETIREEEKRYEMLSKQVTWASNRENEAEDVKQTYRQVRQELREENLARLRKYTNEVFVELYQHQSYTGIEIDKNYNISLIGSTGEELGPELSSGGESGLLNLALRAGIYRILAERKGGAGATLPPFILDEPSTHLDDDHVQELQSMIDTINQWNVPQVLIVDHNDQLIQNAECAIHVESDPSQNTSRVTVNSQGHPTRRERRGSLLESGR